VAFEINPVTKVGERIDKFNPFAEEIIVARPLAGG